MKTMPHFEYWAFFQKSLSSKNPIWGIFSPKIGHLFRFLGVGNPSPHLLREADERPQRAQHRVQQDGERPRDGDPPSPAVPPLGQAGADHGEGLAEELQVGGGVKGVGPHHLGEGKSTPLLKPSKNTVFYLSRTFMKNKMKSVFPH